jgi:hypothetical protein
VQQRQQQQQQQQLAVVLMQMVVAVMVAPGSTSSKVRTIGSEGKAVCFDVCCSRDSILVR